MQLKLPVADVVWAVHVWVAGVAPLKVNLAIVVSAVNAVPFAVTVIPTTPEEGVNVSVGFAGPAAGTSEELAADRGATSGEAPAAVPECPRSARAGAAGIPLRNPSPIINPKTITKIPTRRAVRREGRSMETLQDSGYLNFAPKLPIGGTRPIERVLVV